MIIETVFSWACSFLYGLFSGLEFINLPVDLIQTLLAILEYGTWIVGADILALFSASIIFWFGFSLSVGLTVWVWDRLPLT